MNTVTIYIATCDGMVAQGFGVWKYMQSSGAEAQWLEKIREKDPQAKTWKTGQSASFTTAREDWPELYEEAIARMIKEEYREQFRAEAFATIKKLQTQATP